MLYVVERALQKGFSMWEMIPRCCLAILVVEFCCGVLADPDRCSQPSKRGNCEGFYPKYYYNSEKGKCKLFVYGGCGGNENRFHTKRECKRACVQGRRHKEIAEIAGNETPDQLFLHLNQWNDDASPELLYESTEGDYEDVNDTPQNLIATHFNTNFGYGTDQMIPPIESQDDDASNWDTAPCPPGVPSAMCASDPCILASCPLHENAICKVSFCGGCFAVFYNAEGKKLDCNLPECKKRDSEHCVGYEGHKNFYCDHRWARKNCPRMCGLCKYPERNIEDGMPALLGHTVASHPVEPECYGHEHARCGDFMSHRDFYCDHQWCRENCKYMCGVCKYI